MLIKDSHVLLGDGGRRLFIVLLSLTCVVMLMDPATGVMNGCFERTIIHEKSK